MTDPNQLAEEIHEQYLTCIICQGNFTQPKALPCLHSFCEGCLREYVYSRGYDTLGSFPCPICRMETSLPTQGVSGFPDNHVLNSLKETVNSPQHETSRPTQDKSPPSIPLAAASRDLIPADDKDMNNTTTCFGKYGSSISDLQHPTSVSSIYGNSWIIADKRGNRILQYDQVGNLTSVFVTKGDLQSASVTRSGTILVAITNADQSVAAEYDLKGRCLRNYGNMFSHYTTSGVASDSAGRIIVTMPESHCFCVLSSEGKMVHKFGTKGRGSQNFLQPCYVTTNSDDDIIVSDCGQHCLKVLNKHAEFKHTLGSPGSKPGLLNKPLGMCVDKFGNIVVADSSNQRIQIFPTGSKQGQVIVEDKLPPGIEPISVAVNVDNNLLIVLYIGHQFAQCRVYQYIPNKSRSLFQRQTENQPNLKNNSGARSNICVIN